MLASKYYIDTGESTRADSLRSAKIAPTAAVHLSMNQHVGIPAVPCVKVGDRVVKGQKVGEAAETGLSVPVHSSVCGTVTEITRKAGLRGNSDVFITIENDFETKTYPAEPYGGDFEDTAALSAFLKEKGLVGMGGSGYPVYAKLKNAAGVTKTLIINATECEPYCSSTARSLRERAKSVIRGALILKEALKPEALKLVIEKRQRKIGEKLCRLSGERIELAVVDDRYPIGDERQIIKALFKKELSANALPSAIGCAIFNAVTCADIADAVDSGIPLTERMITVNGDCVREKRNLVVPIGTTVRDAINACGGFSGRPYMLVCGGPMLGYSVDSAQAAVTKNATAVLAFKERFRSGNEDCIHCGRCVKICPMRLMPFYFEKAAKSKLPVFLRNSFEPDLCSECGLCTFICPANVPLNYLIKIAKKRGAING